MFKSILKWGLIVISSGLVRGHPLGALASLKVVYYQNMKILCIQNRYVQYIGNHFGTKQYIRLKMHRNQFTEPFHAKCKQGIYSTHISDLLQDQHYPHQVLNLKQVQSYLYLSLALRTLHDCVWIMCPFCGIHYVYEWGHPGVLCAIMHSSEWEWTRHITPLSAADGHRHIKWQQNFCVIMIIKLGMSCNKSCNM